MMLWGKTPSINLAKILIINRAGLEYRGAEGDGKELLHVGGQRGAPRHDEAHAAPKRLLERLEQQPVQQRRRLHVCSLVLSPIGRGSRKTGG